MALPGEPGRTAEDYRKLVTRLLRAAAREVSLVSFLEETTAILLEVSRNGRVSLWAEGLTPAVRHRAVRTAMGAFQLESDRVAHPQSAAARAQPPEEALYQAFLRGLPGEAVPFPTRRGGLWTPDAEACPPIHLPDCTVDVAAWARSSGARSLAILPLSIDGRLRGLLLLSHEDIGHYSPDDIRCFEDVADALGLAVANHRVRRLFRERVKELTCLFGIARVAGERDRPLAEMLTEIARLLPQGWQNPDHCTARIQLDGVSYETPNFRESEQRQAAAIVVNGRPRGTVEIAYLEPQPQMHEGPFLIEERKLLDEIAHRIGHIVEGREAEEQHQRLQEQLYHAERLTTLGKLTAGLAHEINEPLGSILGFAQLVRDAGGLSDQASEDVDKIIRAALHVREMIRKLMLFGRQTPLGMAPVDLNTTVREGLSLLEPRLAPQRIRLIQRLDPHLPRTVGDPGQLLQVLVNLTVNATQAMPEGGDLTVTTRARDGNVFLAVEDTGCGMSEEILEQIFVPFFTTKDVGQGMGLGLSVVHGIVSAHGGSISVTSEPGKGSRFDVRLPAAGANHERA